MRFVLTYQRGMGVKFSSQSAIAPKASAAGPSQWLSLCICSSALKILANIVFLLSYSFSDYFRGYVIIAYHLCQPLFAQKAENDDNKYLKSHKLCIFNKFCTMPLTKSTALRCFYMFFSLVRLDYAENTIKPCDLIIGIGL